MSTTEALVRAIVTLKKGDTEMIVRSMAGGARWSAGIGNPTSVVLLGEVEPEIEGGEADTIGGALELLYREVLACGGTVPDRRTPEQIRIAAMTDEELDEHNRLLRESAGPGDIVVQVVRAGRIAVQSIDTPLISQDQRS